MFLVGLVIRKSKQVAGLTIFPWEELLGASEAESTSCG